MLWAPQPLNLKLQHMQAVRGQQEKDQRHKEVQEDGTYLHTILIFHTYIPCLYTRTLSSPPHTLKPRFIIFLSEHIQIRPERHTETVALSTSGENPWWVTDVRTSAPLLYMQQVFIRGIIDALRIYMKLMLKPPGAKSQMNIMSSSCMDKDGIWWAKPPWAGSNSCQSEKPEFGAERVVL